MKNSNGNACFFIWKFFMRRKIQRVVKATVLHVLLVAVVANLLSCERGARGRCNIVVMVSKDDDWKMNAQIQCGRPYSSKIGQSNIRMEIDGKFVSIDLKNVPDGCDLVILNKGMPDLGIDVYSDGYKINREVGQLDGEVFYRIRE
jgi:hypothetical protein